MRIIYMGTPDFAVPSLEILLDHGYDVCGVVTATDKPGGRQGTMESAVKKFAVSRGLNVLQPEKLKNPEFLDALRALKADLQVVVAFRMLPEVVWNMPPMGTMNLHGSLLPKYRGAAPINWAVIRGEKETGVTTFLLKHEIDTGDLLFQERIPIGPDQTAGELHDHMMQIGAKLVLKSVQTLESGDVHPIPQPNVDATHAPKLFHDTGKIDFHQSTETIHNLVRGLSPYPGAWTMLDDKTVKIVRTERSNETAVVQPSQYYSDGKTYLKISTLDGFVKILELKMEGKRQMSIREFLNGYKGNWLTML